MSVRLARTVFTCDSEPVKVRTEPLVDPVTMPFALATASGKLFSDVSLTP